MIALPQPFNVATYFVDRNILEGRAQNIAIECADERVTYQQLFERTNRAGNALRNLGVHPEERVLLLLLDSPEFLYSFFSAIKIGSVAVPVNTQAKPHDCEYILNDSRARVAIVSETLLQQLEAISRENLSYLREIIVVGDANSASRYPRLSDLMDAASPDLAAQPTTKDDAAFWLYSSGSTGVPKGCIHLHHDMVVSTHHYAHAILKIDERDRCFSVARLFRLRSWQRRLLPSPAAQPQSCLPHAPLPSVFTPTSNAIAPLSFSPCPRTTPLCSITIATAVPTSTSPAFVTLFPQVKPYQRQYLSVSANDSTLKSSMPSAQRKAFTWSSPIDQEK